jgi:nitrogen fixation protein NifU and related proteins
MSIYQEHIMDHYKHPRHKGDMQSPDITYTDSNPMCGDTIAVYFKEAKGKIIEATHFTQGCAISQAGASMFFEQIQGKSVKDILNMPKEKVLEEFGTELSVSRVKCALLGFSATKKALVEKEARQGPMQDAGGETPEYNDVRD